ncbi:hypothetical protein [Streptomyces lydicus]|uniref:hypothetical protein n=1 Tax=Streptomyces lydicus TaxID=47763 RepID=UPI00342B768D
MSATLVIIGIAVVAGLTWVTGSRVLRVAGWLALALSLVIVTIPFSQDPPLLGKVFFCLLAVGVLLLGMVLWLAGHWLFAFKEHFFLSSVAQRTLCRISSRLDPTRNWVVLTEDANRAGGSKEPPL